MTTVQTSLGKDVDQGRSGTVWDNSGLWTYIFLKTLSSNSLYIDGDPRLVFYDNSDEEVKTIKVDKMNGEEIGKVLVAHGFSKLAVDGGSEETHSDL